MGLHVQDARRFGVTCKIVLLAFLAARAQSPPFPRFYLIFVLAVRDVLWNASPGCPGCTRSCKDRIVRDHIGLGLEWWAPGFGFEQFLR